MKEKEFIFTFGSGQNPGIGYFCRIKAETENNAKSIMNARTLRWSMCYNSEDEAGVEFYDLKEVEWNGMEFIRK